MSLSLCNNVIGFTSSNVCCRKPEGRMSQACGRHTAGIGAAAARRRNAILAQNKYFLNI